jgi:hypothetical protein
LDAIACPAHSPFIETRSIDTLDGTTNCFVPLAENRGACVVPGRFDLAA